MMRRQCETALTVMFLGVISLGYLANVAFLGGGTVSDVSVPCFIISQENIGKYDITQWH